MTADPAPLPPIRRQVVVPTTAADAFHLWTDDLAVWWPFDPHSVYGTGGSVGFVDGALVERGPDGQESVWGTLLTWEPGVRLHLTWHPGRGPEEATELEIRFDEVAVAGQSSPHTLVTVEHRGWERRADGAAARAEYENGWTGVLDRFGDAADRDDTWLVLSHTAGAAAPVDGPTFAHPEFAEHVAFLGRLADLGVLVAAGPLTTVGQPPDGAQGMTVIRVPEAEVARYAAMAETDDQSVVRGLLEVAVTRWVVART